ncbi:MAG: YdcF family protein [Roseicyclus sp.]
MIETVSEPGRGRPDRAILLLGAAVRPGGRASPTLARRTAWAAHLWHAGAAAAIVPCGGPGRHPPAEAEVMCRLLKEAGVPREALHPEARSTSTAENIAFARPILRKLGLGAVLIVSDPWHLPRAALIARRSGLDVETSAPPWRDAAAGAQLKGALREIPAYLAAWLRLRPADRKD